MGSLNSLSQLAKRLEANGSGSLAHHGRVEPGLIEQRQMDLPAHRDPGAEAGRAHRERHQMNLRVGNFFSASVFFRFWETESWLGSFFTSPTVMHFEMTPAWT